MASLDVLCSQPLNLKNEITKIEYKEYFAAHQKFDKCLMAHQYMPKIFNDLHKKLPALRHT